VWLVDQSGCPVVRSFVCSRFIRSFVRSFVVRSFVCSRFVCSFVRSFVVRSFVRFSYVRSFARSFVCSFARSFFRSFVRVSFICSLVRSNCSMTVWSLPYRPSHHACITTAFAVAVPVISHEVGCCVGLSVRLSLSSRHHRHQCFCHLISRSRHQRCCCRCVITSALSSFVVRTNIAFAVAVTVISCEVDCCLVPQVFSTNPFGGSNHHDSVHVNTPTTTPTPQTTSTTSWQRI
jgi:hypothetical protein